MKYKFFAGCLLFQMLLLSSIAASKEIILVHDKGGAKQNKSFLYVINLEHGKVIRKYPTHYGKKEGNKIREGDKKTPIGRYKISYINQKACDSNFGLYSVLTNYPNAFDRRRRNPGSAIAIHGGPARKTWGCFRVLDNKHKDIETPSGCISLPSSHHVKTIYELVKEGYSSPGTPFLSFNNLNRKYRAEEGRRISSTAIKFYRKLLRNKDWSNKHIDQLASSGKSGDKKKRPPIKFNDRERITANASSSLDQFQTFSYDPNNVLDNDPETAWVEGGSGPGRGEFITIMFPEFRYVDTIEIINGYGKPDALYRGEKVNRWKENSRIREAGIEFSNGTSISRTLKDSEYWQSVSLNGVRTDYIKLTIKSVYHGTKYEDDTCISEIRFPKGPKNKVVRPEPILPPAKPGTQASSYLKEKKSYPPANVLDNNPETAWVEGAAGEGKNEWIRINFPSPREINGMDIINGYKKIDKSSENDLWQRNRRVKTFLIEFSHDPSVTRNLEDSKAWQTISFPRVRTKYVKLTIKDVYRDDAVHTDTCVSEIRFRKVSDKTGSATVVKKPSLLKKEFTVSASSVLKKYKDFEYVPENVMDGILQTAWVEGDEHGYGEGEWIKISFPEACHLDTLEIINGYDKTAKNSGNNLWKRNSRVRRFEIEFSDGSSINRNLRDLRTWQKISFSPVRTHYVKFIIRKVYKGDKYDDTCISEIRFP